MSNMTKRVLAMLLALVLSLSCVPGNALPVHADGILDTGVAGLTAEWTDLAPVKANDTVKATSEWTVDGNTITNEVYNPKNAKAAYTTLTLTNNLTEEAHLTFKWEASKIKAGSTITYTPYDAAGNAGTAIELFATGDSGEMDVVVQSGAYVVFTVTAAAPGRSSTETVNFKLMDLNLYVDKSISTTFQAVDAVQGSYTVDGVAITENTVLNKKAAEHYEVTAIPADGYVFSGWYSETTDTFLSTNTTATLKFDQDQTVYPMFLKAEDAVWGVGGASFEDLADAIYCAERSQDKVVVLLKDYTLTESHTIPKDVVVLIPFDEDNTCYTTVPGTIPKLDTDGDGSLNDPAAWQAPYAYRTLTLASGVSLTVKGGLSVSAQHHGGGQITAGAPSGPCGFIKTESGSEIIVENGGALYAWGYIVGSGEVEALYGAAVYENMQIADFRGGSATSSFVSTDSSLPPEELEKYVVLPFTQYYVQNVEVPLTIHSGAMEIVQLTVYAAGSYMSIPVDFIGTSKAMFQMESGASITKRYDAATDRLMIDVYGDVSLNAMTVVIDGFTGEEGMSSAMFNLPITNNITININSGTTSINQHVAMLPGVEVSIAQNAKMLIEEGWNLFVYDRDEWMAEQFVHANCHFKPVCWSSSNGRNVIRTNEDLVDAKIDVNGVLEAYGYLYTTAGGADICSSDGTGTVVLWAGAGEMTRTWQATQENTTVTFKPVPLTAAQLKNSDDSYSSTEFADPDSGAAYIYCFATGIWQDIVTVNFDGNGADGEMNSVELNALDVAVPVDEDGNVYNEITLPENGFTMENGEFLGWDEDPDAEVPTYKPGDTFAVTENTTLYAIWEIQTVYYTVIWYNEDGSVLATETVEQGQDAQNVPAVPEKVGHTGEWDKEATNVAGNLEIHPVYTAINYKLTFKSGRTGEVIDTFEVPYGTTLAGYIPTAPALEGWAFAHWYVITEPSNIAAQIPDTMPAHDLEYYAYYEREVYELSFDVNGGSTEAQTVFQVGYNQKFSSVPSVTKEGHNFLYWADEQGNEVNFDTFQMPARDVKLKAVWEAAKYTVTINGNTGRDDAQYTVGVKYGDVYALPENTFTRIGYTFAGWYAFGNDSVIYQPGETYTITGDVTFVAKWNVNRHTLSFVVNGETVKTMEIDYGTYIDNRFKNNNAPAVNVEGHSLVGWRSDDAAFDSFYMPDKDVVLTASLDKNNYKLTWILDGVETSSYVEYGSQISEPADPTKEGHTFIGWEGDTIPATMPAKELTIILTSTWSVNSYELTWIIDGVTTTETVVYNAPITAPAAPTKEGHTFSGWTGDTVPATMPAEDITITLTSTWDINSYTLTWIIDGVTTTETVVYNAPITDPADPTKEGHTFTGWTGDAIPATMPAKNLTINLTSTWSVNRYTITFDNNGADIPVHPIYADEYGAVLELPKPGKTGYKFLGWFDADGKNWVGEKMPAYDLELTAKWEILTYTVTWVDEAGNTVDTEIVEYGKDATKNPAVPEKEGYTGEWNYIATDVVCDVTIRPVYTVNFYTLTIESLYPSESGAPGNELIEVQVPYGDLLANNIPARVLGIGETVTVDGTNYSGTYTITGWDSWDEVNGYVAIDLDTTTMPAGDYTISNAFSFTGWMYEDEGATYVVDYETVYTDTVAHIDGEAYLFDEDGYIVSGAGLVRFVTENGTVEYYYFCDGTACNMEGCTSGYAAVKNGAHWVEHTNDLLPAWEYTFDDRGVILHHEDTSLNGLVSDGDITTYYIDGVPAYMGLMEDEDGDYYYIRSNGTMVKNCIYWISKTNGLLEEKAYAFDAEGKLIIEAEKNGIVAENDGLYYYEDGILTYAGLIEIEGEFYYVRSNGKLAQNERYWISNTNGLMPEGAYHFDAEGKMYTPDPVAEIIDGYYYVDGVKTYGGLVKIDGDYYYANSSCKIVKNCTYWISKTNGLLEEKAYTFDADGKIVFEEVELKTGFFDGYYYVNGVKTYGGLILVGEDYYYVNSNCQVVKGRSYWISKTNGLLPEGLYTFDETGKMVR